MQKERIGQHTQQHTHLIEAEGTRSTSIGRPLLAALPCITPTMTSPAVRASTPSLYHVGQVRHTAGDSAQRYPLQGRNIPTDENDSGTTATGDLDREAIQVSENMTAQGRTKSLLQRPQLPNKGLKKGENNGRRSAFVRRRPTLHGEEAPGIIDEGIFPENSDGKKETPSHRLISSHLCLVPDSALQLPGAEVREVITREERALAVLAAESRLGPLRGTTTVTESRMNRFKTIRPPPTEARHRSQET